MEIDSNLILPYALEERLKSCKFRFFGELYGFRNNNDVYVVTYIIKEDEHKKHEKFEKFEPLSANNFPAPIQLIGVIYSEGPMVDEIIKRDFELLESEKIQPILNLHLPVVIGYDSSVNIILTFRYTKSKRLVGTSRDWITDADFWDRFAYIRLVAGFHYNSEENTSRDGVSSYVGEKIAEVNFGNLEFSFNGSIIFNGENNEQYGTVQWDSVVSDSSSELKEININGEDHEILVAKMEASEMSNCVNFDLSANTFYAGKEYSKDDKSPSLYSSLIIDSLAIHDKSKSIGSAYSVLKEAACKLLKLTQNYFLNHSSPALVYHFYYPELAHFFTTLYPVDVSEDDLVNLREYYHYVFDLPSNKPIFTRGKAVSFKDDERGILQDVHVGLKPSGIKRGEISLVNGSYQYFHYKQLGTDDSGWGCAYRSLQTIFSWYKLQGWTDRSIPTHLTIQRILVDIKDKPVEFVGSRQWIGSLELSYVLDTLLGVTCRVLTVEKGESISTYAYDIANHFTKHGSPIMIGGGVLAHTIIGVHIDDETDESRFLILDPHYVGPDNMKSVQNKQGVVWKKPDFWKKDTFYNLCLPLRKTGF